MWLLGMTLLAGCFPKNPYPEDKLPSWEERPVTGTFKADYDLVWEATLQVMGEAAPLEIIERTDGEIETGWVRDHSDYIYKTYGGTRIPEPVRWRMRVALRKDGGRTEVEMVAQEQVEKDLISANLEFTGSVYKWIDVPSSTSRERLMLERILVVLDELREAPKDPYDYDYAE
jgi:hypothetical protein